MVIKNFIMEHKCILKSLIFMHNHFLFKNKLFVKKRAGGTFKVGLSILDRLTIKNKGKNNTIIIHDYVRLKNCKITIYGNNNTIIINKHSYLNEVELYMEDDNNEITIGEHTNLCGQAQLATIEGTKIKIGDKCLFSSHIDIRTGDSHSILDLDGNRINKSLDIIIGNHVWIGTKVTCLKGVVLPNDIIVAATTTLCKAFTEPNCIIGGVPSKVIKRDVNWCNQRIDCN